MSDLPTYVLEWEFDAPRELVWRAWTEAAPLSRWYGPGATTIVHDLDVKPGGLWLLEMRWGDNSNYQRVEYQEVVHPERLVWLHAVADADWNVVANPMMPDWPRLLLTTVTFTAEDDRTKMRFVWAPHEASEAEIAGFAAAMDGMGKGWEAGMEVLAGLLAEMRA